MGIDKVTMGCNALEIDGTRFKAENKYEGLISARSYGDSEHSVHILIGGEDHRGSSAWQTTSSSESGVSGQGI